VEYYGLVKKGFVRLVAQFSVGFGEFENNSGR
jgi:hypothetical protein